MKFTRPAFLAPSHPPAYPICPWERTEVGLGIDTGVLGTAFFVSEMGLFLTAAHVVEEYLAEPTPLRILYVDIPAQKLMPVKPDLLAVHPVLDVAIGLAGVPDALTLQRFVLGDGEMAPGDRVLSFGFSHTDATDLECDRPGALPGLSLEMWPAFHEGAVDGFYPDGFGLAKGQPVYVHSAETLGALSGGPVLSGKDGLVYGVTCSGCEEYGTATDLRAILDWPIPFLEGKTLRNLAAGGLVSLRPPSAT